MDVCLFTSPGDLSLQSLQGPCSPTTAVLSLGSSQLVWLQQRAQGYLPPQVRVLGTTCRGSTLGPVHLGRVSSAKRAPAAVLGHVSGANQMPWLLHCVVNACGREDSPSWGAGEEKKLSYGGPSRAPSSSMTWETCICSWPCCRLLERPGAGHFFCLQNGGVTAFVSVLKRDKTFMVEKHLHVTLRRAIGRHGET